MPKYRIVKVEKEQYGKSKAFYRIEKKFLFWFFPCKHKVKRYVWRERKDCWNETYNFNTEEQAREALLELNNPFYEKYKGYTIEKIIDPPGDRYILVCHKGGVIYYYPKSPQEAKDSIDKEEVVIKKTVVFKDKE